MKKHLLFILFIPILLSSSCKKKQPLPTCQTVEQAPYEFLNYWYFPTGSWWVYQLKDSLPAVYDTITCSSAQSFLQPYETDAGMRTCLMMYESSWSHSNRNYFPGNGYSSYESLLSQQDIATNAWYVQWGSITGKPSFNLFFKYPFDINTTIPGNNIIKDTNIVSTPIYTFNKSVHIIVPNLLDTANNTHIYLTSKVGLSKIQYSLEESWELINYEIKQ